MDRTGHAISKICALWLIAQILIPFTAPFKTYDLSGSRSERSHDGLVKEKIASDEALVRASDDSLVPPAVNVVAEPVVRPNQIEEPHLQHAILRL